MANKSNTATQTISTPQSGGALHGIGETFSPDLHTGTGNFTVPIAMLPGRNGFQPQLSLTYNLHKLHAIVECWALVQRGRGLEIYLGLGEGQFEVYGSNEAKKHQ